MSNGLDSNTGEAGHQILDNTRDSAVKVLELGNLYKELFKAETSQVFAYIAMYFNNSNYKARGNVQSQL